MKRFAVLGLLLFCAVSVQGQAVVSGDLKTAGVTNATAPGTLVRFTLQGFGSNIPRVSGSYVVAQASYNFTPNASGTISGSVVRNDNITPSGTFYQVCIFDQGRQFRCANYTIASAAFNLSTAIPDASTPTASATTLVPLMLECTVAVAATTWTCTHNFGTALVNVTVWDNGSPRSVIIPDTIQATSTNVTTLTFTVAQTGTAVLVRVGNISLTAGSLTLNDVVVKAPAATQTILGNYALALDGHPRWKSGTNFFGILSHANTVDRTYTFPNVSFTVPAPSLAQTWTAAHSFSQPITSTLAPGTAPFSIASTDEVVNLTVVRCGTGASATCTTGLLAPNVDGTAIGGNNTRYNIQAKQIRISPSGNTSAPYLTLVNSATASLDFTALAANSCEILTVAVTGATDGDTVSFGIPDALADVDGATERTTFFAWVSATDTVSVRRCNVTGVTTADPSAATVRATVIRF